MKTIFKVFALSLVFSCSFIQVQAQGSPFTTDSKVIHVGFGLGDIYDVTAYNSSPAIMFSYDQGIIDDLGIGNLGVGGIIGYRSYNYSFIDTDYNLGRVFLLARAHYHFNFVNSDVLDFYAGVTAGLRFWVGDTGSPNGLNGTNVTPGAFAGINYYFTNNIGVWGEFGYGVSILTGGLAISF